MAKRKSKRTGGKWSGGKKRSGAKWLGKKRKR